MRYCSSSLGSSTKARRITLCILFLLCAISFSRWVSSFNNAPEGYEYLLSHLRHVDKTTLTPTPAATQSADSDIKFTPKEIQFISDDADNSQGNSSPFITGKKFALQHLNLVIASPDLNDLGKRCHAGQECTIHLVNVLEYDPGFASSGQSVCNSSLIQMAAQISSPISYSAAIAQPIVDRCEWTVTFHMDTPGLYTISINLIEWNGLAGWNETMIDTFKFNPGKNAELVPGKLSRRAPIVGGSVIIEKKGRFYDADGCLLWCIRHSNCTASYQIARYCTLYSGRSVRFGEQTDETPKDARGSLLPKEYLENRRYEEQQITLVSTVNYADYKVPANVSTLFGFPRSFNASVVSAADSSAIQVLDPREGVRPQCRDFLTDSNSPAVWYTETCESDDFVWKNQYGYCVGWRYTAGLGRCHMARADHKLHYVQRADCEYAYFSPSQFRTCMRKRGISAFYTAGKSITGMFKDQLKHFVAGEENGSSAADPNVHMSVELGAADGKEGWNDWAKQKPDYKPDESVFLWSWALMHKLWHFSMDMLRQDWNQALKVLDESIALNKVPKFRYFILSAPLLSEREPHDTFSRAQFANDIIRSDLSKRGFKFIDYTQLLLGLPEAYCSDDGMHPKAHAIRMAITMMANELCDHTEVVEENVK